METTTCPLVTMEMKTLCAEQSSETLFVPQIRRSEAGDKHEGLIRVLGARCTLRVLEACLGLTAG